MTKTKIRIFVEDLLDGDTSMGDTLFNNLLDFAQMYWEGRRPWVYLRSEDTSQTISANNTYETAKSLPSDFRRWYTRFPIVLTDSEGNPQQYLTEIPIDKKNNYRTDNTKFYGDYKNSNFYVCGTPGQSYTIRQFYIQKSTLISSGDSVEWAFPSEYHSIIPFTIAAFYKRGVDYDIINNVQADEQAMKAMSVYSIMEEWDSELAESALNGIDYPEYSPGGSSGQLTGNVPFVY